MPKEWIPISDGPAERPIVLTVDFDATGRKDTTFRDLVKSFPAPLTVWLGAQPPESHRADLSPEEYLAWWAGDSLGASVRVGAVLGYCAGSVFASALADRIEERQGSRPRVVLFNPGKPDAHTLGRDLRSTIESMSLLDAEERADFLRRADKHIDAPSATFDEVSDALFDLFGEASRIVFQRADIDADVGEELIGVFRSYVSYLRAARRVEYRGRWAESCAHVSEEHAPKTPFTERETRWATGREYLLGNAGVARATFRLIGSEA